jgi:HSP20 family molecular chaperone IbpA
MANLPFWRGEDAFRTLFQEVQKTFEDFSRRTPFARFGSDILSPKIDVAESNDAVEVTVELPGVDEKDIDVTLADDVLTIRGEKKSEREEQDKDKNKNWHVVERSYGSFSRAIPLPFGADPTKVACLLTKAGRSNEEGAKDRNQEGLMPNYGAPGPPFPPCAGSTRASIFLRRRMDCGSSPTMTIEIPFDWKPL